MKKLLLASILLISIITQAQTFDHLRSMTEEQAVSFADELVSNLREKVMLWEVEHKSDRLQVIYVPTTTDTIAFRKARETGSEPAVDVIYIAYESFYEGRDLDLEQEGVKKYKFLGTRLKFLDAMPIWSKHFNNEATIDNVKKGYSYKKAEQKENGNWWLYKFEPSGSPYWTIRRFY